MKRITSILVAFCSMVLLGVKPVLAAEEGDIGAHLSFVYVIPFACMLLCIAIFPLVAGEFWEKKKHWFVMLWSLLFLIPFAIQYGMGTMAEQFFVTI